MQVKSSSAGWMVGICLILAVIACQLPAGILDDNSEGVITIVPEEIATIPQEVLPTWTVIPTFTAGAPVLPTATNESIPVLPTPTITEFPLATTEEAGRTEINPMDGAVMAFVPEGEFIMGSGANNAEVDERPAHQVYLDAFWLYQTTVTNSQYRQCIEAEACEGSLGRYPKDDFPAVNVSWFEAVEYCEWAGGQLPTEAQWEKGARGTDGRPFPWGDTMPTCELANYKNCFKSKAIAVGSLPFGASPYGAVDMVGNVWEWVWDWYAADYYLFSPEANPTGPDSVDEEYRVQRGGSFESDPAGLYVTIRGRSGPEKADYRKGFRCVVPETP